MSWKPYMINAIDNYSGSFLMDCKFSEIYTMLKRSDNFGQFYESVEKYLTKAIDELGDELDWETENAFDGFLENLDNAYYEYLENEKNKDVD